MALYRHVTNKEAILEGLVDLVLSEVEEPPPEAEWAGAILDAWIVGYSLWLAGHPLTSGERAAVAERLERDKPFDDSPLFLKHHDQHASPGPHQDVSAFDVGLDLILEGLKGSAPTKRRSAASA